MDIVQVRNLNHYFGNISLKKQVLFDVNLNIKQGQIVILTGPSGSGKTTLLSLIGGLRRVQEGSLKNLGRELKGANEEELVRLRRQIGYIFQAHNLLPFLTARQNVQMSIELKDDWNHREAQARAASILKEVALENRIDFYPDNLSGGQKQRVAIARALVNHPQIILADEPTAALDSKTGRDIVTLMQKLAKDQGCTILLVTHDSRILDIADRIVCMEDGKLSFNPHSAPSTVTDQKSH